MAGEWRRRLWWRDVVAAVAVLAVYSYCLYELPTHTFWSPDEGGKLLQTEALRWDGGIVYALPYAGERVDPQLHFYPESWRGDDGTFIYPMRRTNGEIAFHWPIWFSLVVKLPVALFGSIGGFLVALLAGWSTAMLSGLVAGEIDRRLAAPAILTVGLATPVWFYSLCFWEHTLVAALSMLALLILMRGNASPRALLLALPPLGAAALLRLDGALPAMAAIAACVAVMLLRYWRHRQSFVLDARGQRQVLIIAAVSVAILAVTLMALSTTLTGRHEALLRGLSTRSLDLPRVWDTFVILVSDGFGRAALPGVRSHWVGIAVAGVACSLLTPFLRRSRAQGVLAMLGLALFVVFGLRLALEEDLGRALHGLLSVAPFMILAPLAFPGWRALDSPHFVAVLYGAFFFFGGLLAIAGFSSGADGTLQLGLEWGQRYLLALFPILTVLSLAGLRSQWGVPTFRGVKSVLVLLTLTLIAVGVVLQVRGYQESQRTRRVLADWYATLEGSQAIVTDVWWLPAALAPLFVSKPVFVSARGARLLEWVELAAPAGVTRFKFATLDGFGREEIRALKPRVMPTRHRQVSGLDTTVFKIVRRPQLRPAVEQERLPGQS